MSCVYRSDLFPYIEESLQEHWLLGYIELLQRHKLWNIATEVRIADCVLDICS